MEWPDRIETVEALDEIMTRPRRALVEFIPTLDSPLIILGAGGKMGPTLAALARRAADEAGHPLEIVAVSRFSNPRPRQWLEARGVKTLLGDLFDPVAIRRLPDAANVIYLVGLKFGTAQNPAATWATNTLIPAYVARRYAKARIAALSTGNVYPLSPVANGGLSESAALMPLGEYANSAVARERIFEYFSAKHGAPITLVRLSYALDLRYGVLVDIACKVFGGEPVDVTMGYFNGIWQGDANDLILRSLSLASTPPTALNLTGARVVSVREVALRFGEFLQRPVEIVGAEADTALLSNTARLAETFGAPPTPLDVVMRWTADWIASRGPLLDKPTHFEVRDGSY